MKDVQKEDRTNEKFNKTVLLRRKVVITRKIYIINREMIDMVMTSVRGRGGNKINQDKQDRIYQIMC